MQVVRDAHTKTTVAEFHADFFNAETRHNLLQAVQRAFNYQRPLEWADERDA